MPMMSLTDGMRNASHGAHDLALLIEIFSGYYAADLTDRERGELARYADMIRQVRDGTAMLARDYTRLTDTER